LVENICGHRDLARGGFPFQGQWCKKIKVLGEKLKSFEQRKAQRVKKKRNAQFGDACFVPHEKTQAQSLRRHWEKPNLLGRDGITKGEGHWGNNEAIFGGEGAILRQLGEKPSNEGNSG